jgi:hypothetical protein
MSAEPGPPSDVIAGTVTADQPADSDQISDVMGEAPVRDEPTPVPDPISDTPAAEAAPLDDKIASAVKTEPPAPSETPDEPAPVGHAMADALRSDSQDQSLSPDADAIGDVVGEPLTLQPQDRSPRDASQTDGSTTAEPSATQPEGDTFCTELENQVVPEEATSGRRKRHAKVQPPPGIPPGLAPFVTHAPDTVVYRVLAGEQMPAMEQKTIQTLVTELHRYMEIAVERDLIGEALYVQGVMGTLRADRAFVKLNADHTIVDIEGKLKETTDELERRLA